MNKPLCESLSGVLAEISEASVAKSGSRKGRIVRALTELLKEDAEFIESMSVGTQATRQVSIRFERMSNMLREALS